MAVVERRTFFQLLSLLFHASRPLFASYLLLFVLTSAAPAAIAVCIAELVQSTGMLGALSAGRTLRAMAPGLAGLVALFTLQQVMAPIVRVVIAGLGSRLALLLREKIMEATLAPDGVEHLEDPATSDMISLAAGVEDRAFAPEEMASALFAMCSARLQGILSAFLLFPY
jgi:ATP-binding cassette subfamily B protein